MNQLALRVQERTSRCWMISFISDYGWGQIKTKQTKENPPWGLASEGRSSLSWTRVQLVESQVWNQALKKPVCASADWREDDVNVNSLNKLLCKGSVQLPDWELPPSVSSCTDCTFISSHNTSKTWAAGFLSSLAQIALFSNHHERLSISVVSFLSTRGRGGLQLMKLAVFFYMQLF